MRNGTHIHRARLGAPVRLCACSNNGQINSNWARLVSLG